MYQFAQCESSINCVLKVLYLLKYLLAYFKNSLKALSFAGAD